MQKKTYQLNLENHSLSLGNGSDISIPEVFYFQRVGSPSYTKEKSSTYNVLPLPPVI